MSRATLTTALRRASLTVPPKSSQSPVFHAMPRLRRLATESFEPQREVAQGKKGPTAIVFQNMGGPSTTSEVGDFLSRLFVRSPLKVRELTDERVRCRLNPPWPLPVVPWPTHFSTENTEHPKAIP
jgi:ferrochelatase